MFYNSLVNDYRKVTFMLTIKEVAQAANLSVATVSRVLNHDKRVALKTKEHVLKVVKSWIIPLTRWAGIFGSAQPKKSWCFCRRFSTSFFPASCRESRKAFRPEAIR